MQGAWVYIMTNRPNGILYTGCATDLVRSVWEHREGVADGFTRDYRLKRLVYFERHETLLGARQRESNIKHWKRAWKARLILEFNSTWADLYESII